MPYYSSMDLFNIFRNWLKKMKFKLFSVLLCAMLFMTSHARAADGLHVINVRGKVMCGTNLSAPALVSKTEDGRWKGFDADICQAFSLAIFGQPDKFEMVDIKANEISKALRLGKIDVMLGGANISAKADMLSSYTPATLLYYDQQGFLARGNKEASSMEDFRGAKVCAVANTADYSNVEDFSLRYDLDFSLLPFNSEERAKQAFLLNRCQILTGNRIFLNGVLQTSFENYDPEESEVQLLPEAVALKPSYILVAKDNDKLQAIARWIVNALQLSDLYGISSANAKVKIGLKNSSQRNLVGDDSKLWLSFGLNPTWVRQALSFVGNYGEIYERNFGKNSSLKLDRAENNYLKDGGLINPIPFL